MYKPAVCLLTRDFLDMFLRRGICKQNYKYTYTKLVFTCVCTFVQRGSKFCFVVADTLLRNQNTEFSNSPILQFHHAFRLQHITPLHAPLLCSLVRQPCPAALPGSLAQQPCTVAFAWQHCPVALPASLARQPCPAALPGSLARQPCPAALPARLAEKFASCFTAVGRHACSIAYFYSA
jgi:hypothetical protein